MSSRALRKAQRELEEQEQLRKLQQEQAEEEEDEEDEAPSPVAKKSAFSAFAMLDDDNQDDQSEDVDEEEDIENSHTTSLPIQEPAPTSSKSKKKKKKNKSKAKASINGSSQPPPTADPSLDEIDLALKSLSTKPSAKDADTNATTIPPAVAETCSLLSIDTSHLHASNEMRRLFGRAAIERDGEDGDEGGRRRRGQQQQGLAAALRGRQAQGGRASGLASLSLRRNIFVQGKEEWPVAPSGGLGMEVVEKRLDGTVEYRYSHSRPYQGVQSEFETCVASMDPNRMVQLLQYNPYHISTLLQVSEIAKQERDHATSGDLLERALFSFGRSVHSTFAHNLSQGKARMDFRRPENREFWLAACRYISNLGMRSTWRTVYEWSKLLLSLDPETDPYSMSIVIDQYALRARSPQSFLDLANSAVFSTHWKHLPNIQLSKGLALVQTGETAKGKQTLFSAVSKFPHVVAALLQQLSIDAPPAVWGKQPRSDAETLHTELYAKRAKDLWNTPEASALLAEISAAVPPGLPSPAVVDTPITLAEARLVLMTDDPALIANLPHSITSSVSSSSDPLPPVDNLVSYTTTTLTSRGPPTTTPTTLTPAVFREIEALNIFFRQIFRPNAAADGEPEEVEAANIAPGVIQQRLAEQGIDQQTFMQRTQRFVELRNLIDERMGDLGNEDIFEEAMEGMAENDAERRAMTRQAFVEDGDEEDEGDL